MSKENYTFDDLDDILAEFSGKTEGAPAETVVIPAAKKVLKTHPDTHFLFVGDGPMYDELIAELEKENIKDNFHFAGLVPPDAVASCIAQAELLWHLSLHEGLPRAVVQALAVGIPAVGFALDGTPEVVINGETGFTTPAEDIDMVAEYTAKLLDDPEMRQRMGSAGKAKVLEQFDWRKMAEILEKEYISLLEKKTR